MSYEGSRHSAVEAPQGRQIVPPRFGVAGCRCATVRWGNSWSRGEMLRAAGTSTRCLLTVSLGFSIAHDW